MVIALELSTRSAVELPLLTRRGRRHTRRLRHQPLAPRLRRLCQHHFRPVAEAAAVAEAVTLVPLVAALGLLALARHPELLRRSRPRHSPSRQSLTALRLWLLRRWQTQVLTAPRSRCCR